MRGLNTNENDTYDVYSVPLLVTALTYLPFCMGPWSVKHWMDPNNCHKVYHMVNSAFRGVVSMVFRAKPVQGNMYFPGEVSHMYVLSLGCPHLIFPSVHMMFSPQFTEVVGSPYGLVVSLC